MNRSLILVGGGARSGKSRFALARALEIAPRRIFVATAEALDDEMAARIARHQEERGGVFETVEAPLALPETLDAVTAGPGGAGFPAAEGGDRTGPTSKTAGAGGPPTVVLVDCLTLWVSNLLVGGATAPQLTTVFDALEASLRRRQTPVILVTNEVGLGLVPQTPLGRLFRDAIGDLHQRLAATADEIYLAAMGLVLRLHPGPVEVARRPGQP